MNNIYTIEQFICASLSCYKIDLIPSDFKDALESFYQNMSGIIVGAVIMGSEKYINYESDIIRLKEEYNFDDIIEFDGAYMTIRDYLKLIAGSDLVEFFENERIYNECAGRS